MPTGVLAIEIARRLVGRDLLAVDLDDDVALLEPGRAPRTRPERPQRTISPLSLGNAERRREILVDRLQADAEIAALTGAGRCISASITGLASSGGDREADADRAAGRRDQRRIDADDIAVQIEHRAAADCPC